MILESIRLYKYKLALSKKLVLQGKEISHREGFILEIVSENGIKVISEIAPLPYFSAESLSDVITEVSSFKKKFMHQQIPPDILSQLSIYTPSMRFGIESAFLQLTAQSKELTLLDLLNPNAKHIVPVNALLSGSHDEITERASLLFEQGYRTFKIKVGRLSLDKEIEVIHKVREIIGDESLIRLDANRAFDIVRTVSFYNNIKSTNIDYIEEPFQSFEILSNYLTDSNCDIPIALDESLSEMTPEELNPLFALKAIVLKPTLIGYTNSMMFAKKAIALGIQPVISSSFESSIGLYVLASMGAIIDSKIPIGLDTLSWFKEDLVTEPLTFTSGTIDISQFTKLNSKIDFSKLSEVALDNE